MARSSSKARRRPRRNPQGVISITRGGYGFVDTPEGEYFIPASKMGGAFPGDVVEIVPTSVNRDRPQPGKLHNQTGRKPSARVVAVIKRRSDLVVGRYELAEPFGIVIPDDDRIRHDVFTIHRENPPVDDGDVVRVRITRFPSRRESALGVVEEVLGSSASPSIAIDRLIASHELATSFSAEALEEAAGVDAAIEEALAAGHRDLRDRVIFTIDPVDARDFDDALSLERRNGRWVIGVHIADVSSYVVEGGPLDREARERATSVYLVDRVLPMLPEALSNGICSLQEGRDRRCLSVEMTLDDEARLQGVDFFPSVIRSKRRFSYEEAQALIDEGPCDEAGLRKALDQAAFRHGDAPAREPAPCAAMLSCEDSIRVLNLLAQRLRELRRKEGAIDLESREVSMKLDSAGKPVGYELRVRTDATSLVEQCMILANACVATFLVEHDRPALFRVHEPPSSEALATLVPILQEFAYDKQLDLAAFTAGDPYALQQLLALSARSHEALLISNLLLRCLKQARYKDRCLGHYALGLSHYCHFTSPIRRYPDLVVHRALKAALGREQAPSRLRHLEPLADHCSAMERVADKAAFESQELKLVEYMSSFVGEVFSAVIMKVTSYGFFVELDNCASGLVTPSVDLHEPFAYDEQAQTLTGCESSRRFRLGQRLAVRLTAADPSKAQLDFALVV